MEDLKIFLCSLEKMYETRYVAFSELEKKKAEYEKLLAKVDKNDRNVTKKIEFYFKNREKLNKKFVRKMQKEEFKIEGNSLDPQQIEAVVACEDAELILASAGSGKSASLLAKVNYLVRGLNIPEEEVLVIAFTRKVVKELKERMRGSGVEICTFHSFGNKIIQDLGLELKLVPDDFLEKVSFKILSDFKNRGVLTKDFLEEFGGFESLQKLIISTLQLQKNEQISFKEFYARIMEMDESKRKIFVRRKEIEKRKKEKEKALKFYDFYIKVAKTYSKILRENRMYDFSDMLSWATRIISKKPKGNLKYKYVLVDEVQDLSLSKSLLLQAILKNCEEAKLFAVGDDWQSIYRFAGSNLGVLKDFEKTFLRKTYRGVIRRTYRFGQPTAWVSEYFIRKNPHQSKKKVQTFKKGKTPIEIILSEKCVGKIPKDYEAMNKSLEKMYREMGDKIFEKQVQVISRYNKDIYRLVRVNGSYKNAKIIEEKEDGTALEWKVGNNKLKVAFCSMHKSKGITRDIVFVINMNEGVKGMPSTRADNPILAIMLAKPDPYPLAEERRLFYVAITRAKEKTVLVSEKGKISRFVREIAKNLGSEAVELVE